MEGMTVDAFHIGEAQHLILILAQLIVLQADRQRVGMQGKVGDAEQGLFKLSCLVVVNVELAFLEGAVGLSVLHRVHASDALGIERGAHVKVFQIEILLLLGRSRKRSKNKEQAD